MSLFVPPRASISCRGLTIRFPVQAFSAPILEVVEADLEHGRVGGRIGRRLGAADVIALDGVNLDLRPGDRLGLIGHNGSGKTTLLRALSGAYQPDAGRLEVTGRIAALLDLTLGLDPTATGFQNIRLRGRLAGLSGREIEAQMDDIAEFSGLGPFLAMPVKTYSAGMQARLAFAVATAVDCDVLLMDEWITVGDAEFQTLAHQRLMRLMEQAGILVLATHDAQLLRTYCNKIMRLDAGRASKVMDIDWVDALLAD